MNTYQMITQVTASGLPWQYNFEIGSDAMALDYANRVAKQFQHVPWFMGLEVWRSDPDNEEWAPLGIIKLNEITTRCEKA